MGGHGPPEEGSRNAAWWRKEKMRRGRGGDGLRGGGGAESVGTVGRR